MKVELPCCRLPREREHPCCPCCHLPREIEHPCCPCCRLSTEIEHLCCPRCRLPMEADRNTQAVIAHNQCFTTIQTAQYDTTILQSRQQMPQNNAYFKYYC